MRVELTHRHCVWVCRCRVIGLVDLLPAELTGTAPAALVSPQILYKRPGQRVLINKVRRAQHTASCAG